MTGGLSKPGLERMRGVLARHVERGGVPGLVALISRGGEVHVEAIGAQAVGGSPMRRDTIFRIASMTKPVVAVVTLSLVEGCRLRLDEPVDRLLPELADRRVLRRLDGPLDDTVPARRPVSVRDLLTLRMGLGFIQEPSAAYPIQRAMDASGVAPGPMQPAFPPDEWMKRLGALPLVHQPGEGWLYHTGFDVLCVLLARAAGRPLEVFLRERVFEPLGMRDTGFSVPAASIDRLATCYHTDPATGGLATFDEARGGAWSRPPVFPSELVSTADDYLAFGRMLLAHGRHGRERILSRASVALMTADQLTPEQAAAGGVILGAGRGWGFGVSVVTRRNEVWATPGRFGWDGGLGTSWASDRGEDLVGIALTQRAFDSPVLPAVLSDFWTQAYASIDD